MPFFFDLSSTFPLATRSPFEPVVVHDEVPADLAAIPEQPAEPIVDTGLPIPSHYDLDVMRLLVQDPFHLYVYWQLKDNPYDRLARLFPNGDFHTVLKLIDETNNIAVLFDAAFGRNYWFSVFPDRTYKVELGVRSAQYGYIKLLTSNTVTTPRGTVSDQEDIEPAYQITADEYVQVLRESHLVPERAFTPEGVLRLPGETLEEQADWWETLPGSFKQLLAIISDVQAGRDYEKLWEKLSQAELTALVREFLTLISRMSGNGELGYMLLLRHLPELLRRALAEEGAIEVSGPLTTFIAERLGMAASELNAVPSELNFVSASERNAKAGKWLPSMNS
ncbi:MAG TPA: DUF4912 domain-containing protein [Blastocatellia bacterium]|nr:DUF4912 domain-containing protein [Blastocatellia bacterium]